MAEILNLQRLSKAERAAIEAVDASVAITDAAGWFNGEVCDTWPDYATRRFIGELRGGHGSRAERDEMLVRAEIILGGYPCPLDLRGRAPKLKWFHQRQAGANNLHATDLWGSDVMVSTSRSVNNVTPIAEYIIMGALYFARSLNRAWIDHRAGAFERSNYAPVVLAGKTMCIAGAGGIGSEAGRLAAAIGMRVTGTRSRAVENPADLPPGFSEIAGPDGLYELLAEADYVAVCVQLTQDTERMFDAAAFDAMKPGAVLINISRGEPVDEDALFDALESGRLGGAVLDVYVGESEHPPPARLWNHPNVLITPHSSGSSEIKTGFGVELFCENLRAYLDGRPLKNVIDWERGY
ncbi:MAG: D-2-hydroxyacid dehydrogenase [Rhodospirillales bacterium]|jgi:phosphoglycerate dehydrogenase-like enzyme|nr:D-2-hydroxyacid dehydrogenase [Rhodospirillales bacterium]MDP6643941.1 D-2-hydroxyacid dehydrogenase [Rhodospirillales bacterium]MDP6841934.1 D-2-hydroxyacid dehydrogenase [Rhodospirillales bacterium]